MELNATLQRVGPIARALLDDDAVVGHARRAGTASRRALRARRRPTKVSARQRALQAGTEYVRAARAAARVVEARQRREERRRRLRRTVLVVTGLGTAGGLALWRANQQPTAEVPA